MGAGRLGQPVVIVVWLISWATLLGGARPSSLWTVIADSLVVESGHTAGYVYDPPSGTPMPETQRSDTELLADVLRGSGQLLTAFASGRPYDAHS